MLLSLLTGLGAADRPVFSLLLKGKVGTLLRLSRRVKPLWGSTERE